MKKIILIAVLALFVSCLSIAQGTSTKKPTLGSIDTLYFNGQWEKAKTGYESFTKEQPDKITPITWNRLGYSYHNLGDENSAIKYYLKATSMPLPTPVKPVVTSRLARSYAILNQKDKALVWLDSAVHAGYSSMKEMDTLKDYNSIRKDPRFAELYKKMEAIAFPCSVNPKNREFDFWVGEWDVYITGTTSPKVGHSLVSRASGGCMLLENWTSLGPAAHEGKSINYFDPALKYWEQDWIGSDGSPVRFTNGQYTDGAMRFVFSALQPDGTTQPGRFIFYNQGANQVRQFSETSADGGKTWTTNYDYTYVRR